MRTLAGFLSFAVIAALGCGDDGGAGPDAATCDLDPTFAVGGDGHAQPLAATAGQARAGRLTAADLPATASGLQVWSPGDFVLANDRVALVIEDAGPSDLYDPWGGRPVGVALVNQGQLTHVGDFGELLVLTGRYSVVTEQVTVLSDGSDGEPAVVRAVGMPAPTPFFENITGALFREDYSDIPTAIDYVLAPGADYVDVFVTHRSSRPRDARQPFTMHAMLYAARLPPFAPGVGFDGPESKRVPYLGFIDPAGASYAYEVPGQDLSPLIEASGFISMESEGFTIAACAETRRHHARLYIGGPDVDPLAAAVATANGTELREVTGVVREADGSAAAGVRVHAVDGDGAYLTRTTTDANGAYALRVPAATAVELTAYRRGDAVAGPVAVAAGATSADLDLAASGWIEVVATELGSGAALPVRVQVLPEGASAVPSVPRAFGEPGVTGGRLHVAFPTDGKVTLRVPPGSWDVVVSRGYEYELHRQSVTVTAGETAEVAAALERVVDTTGSVCGDFHIHTHRSNDSGDDARLKLESAVADGVEVPVRSEHEFVATFQPLIEELGLADWAYGIGSIEMTSMEIWGHMGVVPLEPDASAVNAGAPLWQRYPTAEEPDVEVETLSPAEVFAQVRARPERPTVIINHPRGGANYFEYVGFDRTTGTVKYPEHWDTEFTLVEIFNDSGWLANRGGLVQDWLTLLDGGRRIFAVGSSDSHGIRTSPVGYPRTCMHVGTDDPRALDAELIRDTLAAGKGTVSGGIYVDAWVGEDGPGSDVEGAGTVVNVRVRVQAASWVDVDALDVVVDGQTVATIPIGPDDGDPLSPSIRFEDDIPVEVAAGGSYVIVAAYGSAALEPVHPGRAPFGVTNPIFLHR